MSHTSRKTTNQALQKVGARTAARNAPTQESPPSKHTTKTAHLIAMLQADGGVSVEEISAALGWLPHSTRAALSGLRKAGHDVERIQPDEGPSRYRITAALAGQVA